eukprot:GHVS01015625.1.p1 GENE.GHVS01015625.1~~GHVS01015625.1.p1  ORF type:complete len:720 (+),score=154.40 GHVS01015625.1:35-2194(+)
MQKQLSTTTTSCYKEGTNTNTNYTNNNINSYSPRRCIISKTQSRYATQQMGVADVHMTVMEKTQITSKPEEANIQILQKAVRMDDILRDLRGDKAALEHRCQALQQKYQLQTKETEQSIRKRDARIAGLERDVRKIGDSVGGSDVSSASDEVKWRQKLETQLKEAYGRMETIATELRATKKRFDEEEAKNRKLSSRVLSMEGISQRNNIDKQIQIQKVEASHREELERTREAAAVARGEAAHRQNQAEVTRSERDLFSQMKQLVKVYKKKVDAAEKTENELQKSKLLLTEMDASKQKVQEKQRQMERAEEQLGVAKAMEEAARCEVDKWQQMAKDHLRPDEQPTPEALQRTVICVFHERQQLMQKMTEAETSKQRGDDMLSEKSEQLRKVTSQCERLRSTVMIKDKAIESSQQQRKQLEDRFRLLQIELTGERRTPTGDRTERAIKSLQGQIAANEQALAERDKLVTELCKMKEDMDNPTSPTPREPTEAISRACVGTETEEKKRLHKLVEALSEENRVLKAKRVDICDDKRRANVDELSVMRNQMEKLKDKLSFEQTAFREYQHNHPEEGNDGKKRRREEGGDVTTLRKQVEAEQARAEIVKKYLEEAIADLREFVHVVLGWELRLQDDESESYYTLTNLNNKHDGSIVFTRRKDDPTREKDEQQEMIDMRLNGYYISRWELNETWRNCYNGNYPLFCAKTLVLEADEMSGGGAEGRH